MSNTAPVYSSSWFSKIFECIYLYIAVVEIIFILISTLSISRAKNNYEVYFIHEALYAGVIYIFLSIVYSIWWHRNEKKGHANSEIRHAWLRGVVRYFLAYEMSLYGFGKIFKTQFAPLYSRYDQTIGSLSGFDLTWNYFGYSHTFAVILGSFQIGGAILLLFRRTSLLGVFILLPVMVNIVLINFFYSISPGALRNSLILTIGLQYLLLLRWKDLKTMFFNKPADLPNVSIGFLKPLIKLLPIAAAFGSIFYFVTTKEPAIFSGKWKVQELKRNGKIVNSSDWQTNANSWCNIYIEETGKLSLSPNPYIFDKVRARFANYTYNTEKHSLKLVFANMDTENVAIINYNGKSMQWNTILDKDTLQIKLCKEENRLRVN